MPSDNHIIVASAGSGKTTTIVDEACGDAERRAALITYTVNGSSEISSCAYRRFGAVPPHVTISTWYAFLLRHFVRPYQNCLYDPRVFRIHFVNGQSARYTKADDVRRHYFSNNPGSIYVDKVSKFACEAINRTGGLPIRRFEQIFDCLFIDESQDLAGYDLELIEILMNSQTRIDLVGDPRQATYSTNSATKNKKYAGPKIVTKFDEWEKKGLCKIAYHNYSHRCVQAICDLADSLNPDMPATQSRNDTDTDHDGVFAVQARHVDAYLEAYNPQPLRYNRKIKDVPGSPINFGAAKGMTFERTLIYPHAPLKKFIKTGEIKDAGKAIAGSYVAITRARQSAAFVVDDGFKPFTIPLFEP